MPVHWDDLKIFQNAVRTGDYTTAAKSLGINRTTIGRRIGRLETAIGQPLWEQGVDGYAPTGAGAAVLRAALAMERAMGRLGRELQLVDDAPARVRVAGTAGIADLVVPNLAEGFGADAPRLELVGGDDALLAVAQRRADIGIAIAKSKPRTLGGVSPGPFLQGLYTRKGVAVDRRIGYGHAVMLANPRGWARVNKLDAPAMEVNGLPALLAAVKGGFGAAWLWDAVAARDQDLVRLDEKCPRTADANIWIVHRLDIAIDPGVQRVKEELFRVIGGMFFAR